MSNYAILIGGIWIIGTLVVIALCKIAAIADDEINHYMRDDEDGV